MSATTLQRPAAPTAARPVAPLNDQEVQAYLRTGLRNRWWPLLPSRFIGAGAKPLGLVRLGEKLVVWRDTAGAVHVQRDRCPHRAVPLSRGMNEGDRLRCIYHGVEIGPDGTVLNVPGQPGCPLEGKKAVRTFPSREIAGAIFAWFGDDLHQEPAPFDPPVELVGEEYSNFCCYADWAAPWRCVYDNLMDPMHGTFLHADSHTMYQGETQVSFVTRDTPTGFFFEKAGQRDVNFDWSELVDSGAFYVRLEIPYPPSGGPGGNFGIISEGADGLPRARDPNGLSLGFRVSQRRKVVVTPTPANAPGTAQRVDRRSPVFDHAEPIKIGHVVLFASDLRAGRILRRRRFLHRGVAARHVRAQARAVRRMADRGRGLFPVRGRRRARNNLLLSGCAPP